MHSQKNVRTLQFAKNVARTSGLAATQISDYSTLTDGEILVTTPDNIVVDTTTCLAKTKLKLIQRSGTTLLHSPILDVNTITEYKIATYSAAAQQIDYIGYNGSTGSIEVIDDNLYSIRLMMTEDDRIGQAQQIIKHGAYKSGSTATELAIAKGLCESLINNFSREANRDIKFERCYSGAQLSAISTFSLSVVYGSKYVKFSGDATSLVAAGTILRIGGTGAGVTPCYVVAGHDSGAGANRIYELDIPYQGTTDAAVAHANVESCVLGGNWGIILTGLARPNKGTFNPKFDRYTVAKWKVGADCGDTTIVTNSVTPKAGNGNYKQIAELEFFCQGNEGNIYQTDYMFVPRADYSSSTNYDVLTITAIDKSPTGGISDVSSPIEVIVAIATGKPTSVTGAITSVVDLLDAWIGATTPSLTAQVGNLT